MLGEQGVLIVSLLAVVRLLLGSSIGTLGIPCNEITLIRYDSFV